VLLHLIWKLHRFSECYTCFISNVFILAVITYECLYVALTCLHTNNDWTNPPSIYLTSWTLKGRVKFTIHSPHKAAANNPCINVSVLQQSAEHRAIKYYKQHHGVTICGNQLILESMQPVWVYSSGCVFGWSRSCGSGSAGSTDAALWLEQGERQR